MRRNYQETEPVQLIAAPPGLYWIAYDVDTDTPDMDPVDFFALCAETVRERYEDRPKKEGWCMLPMGRDGFSLEFTPLAEGFLSNTIGMFRGDLVEATRDAARAQSRRREEEGLELERKRAEAGNQGEVTG